MPATPAQPVGLGAPVPDRVKAYALHEQGSSLVRKRRHYPAVAIRLEITVRGPSTRALEFVQRFSPTDSGASDAASSGVHRPSDPEPLPPCPDNLLALSTRLSAASILSPQERVKRAWICGCIAGRQLDGQSCPEVAAISIDLPSSYFVVLRGHNVTEPRILRSARDYNRILEGNEIPGVGHSFPSETEARVYLAGDVAEEESAVLPLTSDFGPAGFQPYALDLVGLGLASDESPLVLAYVVMTRRDGFLLCLPELALPLEVLQGGNEAAPQDLIGPSLKVEVQCAVSDEDAILQMPSPLEGKTMSVLLVDFASAALACLQAVRDKQKLEELAAFDVLDITVVPDPDDVVTRANAWAQGLGGDQLERIQYYSADEVPETPLAPQAKRATRRKGPGAGTGGGTATRRPTVASLAESIEALTQTLPAISEKLQELTLTQEAMEAGALRPPERASALRKPLGSSPTIGLPGASMDPAGLLKQMPPPRSTTSPAKTPRVSFSKAEAAEIA